MKSAAEVPSTSPIRDVEEIFDRTSQYGRYQLFMLLVIQYSMVNAAGNYVFISFASLKPTCRDASIQVTVVHFFLACATCIIEVFCQ